MCERLVLIHWPICCEVCDRLPRFVNGRVFQCILYQMEAITVTTIAGSGGREGWVDGKAVLAAFSGLRGICYSEAQSALLIADGDANRIRCVRGFSEKKKSDLNQAISYALIETGALPVDPLITLIFEFAVPLCTFSLHRHRLISPSPSTSAHLYVVSYQVN